MGPQGVQGIQGVQGLAGVPGPAGRTGRGGLKGQKGIVHNVRIREKHFVTFSHLRWKSAWSVVSVDF